MNNNPLTNFTDEVGEKVLETAKIVKKQLVSKPVQQNPNEPPPPSKKILNQLNQATAQLAKMRLDKVREELEKQRLKIKPASVPAAAVDSVEVKSVDDAVAQTLRSSKSTGEFGKNIGG